jgi:hypothetical protein
VFGSTTQRVSGVIVMAGGSSWTRRLDDGGNGDVATALSKKDQTFAG